MYHYQLCQVENHFQLQKIGLTIIPEFSALEKGKWFDFFTEIKIVKNKSESFHKAHIGIWHFNIQDPSVGIDKRWRIIESFPDADKNQIPIGCRLFVMKEDFEKEKG